MKKVKISNRRGKATIALFLTEDEIVKIQKNIQHLNSGPDFSLYRFRETFKSSKGNIWDLYIKVYNEPRKALANDETIFAGDVFGMAFRKSFGDNPLPQDSSGNIKEGEELINQVIEKYY
jgi:hypothetical protein